MGFFKKLKERLFTLDGTPVEEKEITPKKEKEIKSGNDKSSDVLSVEKKLDKKETKQKLKARKKENKLNKYVAGLSKTGSSFSEKIKEIQNRHNVIDEELFEDLEEMLIMADISAKLVMEIIDEIKKEVKNENVTDPSLISEIIADKLFVIYTNKSVVDTTLDIKEDRLNVIMFVGVNGAGKTTTIAKLSKKFIDDGKKVLIAAADTFRAGAVQQLAVWADRVGADIVKSDKDGADPASVVFDGVKKAKESDYDILIIDTAGRLQNKVNLMNELEKMSNIIKREIPGAPHETLLVIDATTGQNGVSQAKNFKDVTPVSGIVLTKMDGTSKGGIVLTIKDELELAVKYMGLGESLDDLQEFDLDAFIYGMTKGLIDES
ncbi:MAG: signal recognition particle-docking protein FtsY [Mycoplasmataceae bacterium]|nr:signal recognition particle-docking protein FtsY [Mycoplasmataceae bacterium]